MDIIFALLVSFVIIYVFFRLKINVEVNDNNDYDRLKETNVEFDGCKKSNAYIYIDFDNIEINEEFLKSEHEFIELCKFVATNGISLFTTLENCKEHLFNLEKFLEKVYHSDYKLVIRDEWRAFVLLLACFFRELEINNDEYYLNNLREGGLTKNDAFANVFVKIYNNSIFTSFVAKFVKDDYQLALTLDPYNVYLQLFKINYNESENNNEEIEVSNLLNSSDKKEFDMTFFEKVCDYLDYYESFIDDFNSDLFCKNGSEYQKDLILNVINTLIDRKNILCESKKNSSKTNLLYSFALNNYFSIEKRYDKDISVEMRVAEKNKILSNLRTFLNIEED